MAIKIEMLRCFCAVAEAGNLADAARQLGRTQSAVSMMLKQFENHLNNPLFENERKNRLTSLGEHVFTLSLRQLQQFDSAVQAIEVSARAPQGILRIAAVPSIATLIYPPLVRHMASSYPGVKIELRDSDTNQVIEALVDGWADIGIASEQRNLNDVTVAPFLNDRFGLVCAAQHPLGKSDQPITIDDVLSAPFLRNALCERIETPGFREKLEETGIIVHNTQSLLAMVNSGDWVTILPHSVMGFAPDTLHFRLIADLTELRQTYLYLRNQTLSGGIAKTAHMFIAGWADKAS